MISLQEAQDLVQQNLPAAKFETIPTYEGSGRVIAEAINNAVDMPPFDNAAMDGYAFRAEDGESLLNVVGLIGAGEVFDGSIESGQALRIMTGAPVPLGADTVVRYEDVDVFADGSQIKIAKIPKAGRNIRFKGEAVPVGTPIASEGDVLNSSLISSIATALAPQVKVFARPKVALLAMGTELLEITSGEPLKLGQIPESNRYMLGAQAIEAGAEAKLYPIVADEPAAMQDLIRQAASECDIVVSSGGASVGDFDFTSSNVESIGKLIFNMIDMKPGKGQTFGLVGGSSTGGSGTPYFGLSGNPGAAFLGFEMLVRPAIRKLLGFKDVYRRSVKALANTDVEPSPKLTHFVRGYAVELDDGTFVYTPGSFQSSSYVTTDDTDGRPQIPGYAVFPKGSGVVKAGEVLNFTRLD